MKDIIKARHGYSFAYVADSVTRRGCLRTFGPVANGIPLEVFGIEIDNDDVLVIHAMKLRARYRDDYHKVMECQHG